MTVEEVAEVLRVTPEAVRDYVQDGLIRYRRLRGSSRAPLRFREEDVEEYLARYEVAPTVGLPSGPGASGSSTGPGASGSPSGSSSWSPRSPWSWSPWSSRPGVAVGSSPPGPPRAPRSGRATASSTGWHRV